MDKPFDVISVGSTLLRLSVPPGERLETASTFRVHTAGTESNTMVALARLGLRTAWVSRLRDNPLGRRVANEIRYHGVDVSRIVWAEAGRNEVFFVEYGASPRPTQVIYDRAYSALAELTLADLDLDFILSGRVLHLTGILPALSPGLAELTGELMDRARRAGVTVSFDLNYRAKLWPPEEAARVLGPLLKKADLLFVTQEDAAGVLGLDGPPEEVAAELQRACRPRVSLVTLGGRGGLAFDGRDYYRTKGYEVEVQDRLGAGDCFSAGVLCGWLEGSLQTGLDFGAAMAALKLGLHGDYFVSDRQEVLRLLSAGGREVGR